MVDFLITVSNWSEVWALLIPLTVLLIRSNQPKYLNPVIAYVIIALILDILIDIGYVFKDFAGSWLQPNLYLYHLHSIVRYICFSLFFSALKQPPLPIMNKVLSVGGAVFLFINFIFFEDFFSDRSLSSRLFAFESALLLYYCLQYFLFKMKQDIVSERRADYWVVIGLSVYVVFNFPYFLIYKTYMDMGKRDIMEHMWHFHNFTFIIFCIFIAKAFYVARKR